MPQIGLGNQISRSILQIKHSYVHPDQLGHVAYETLNFKNQQVRVIYTILLWAQIL